MLFAFCFLPCSAQSCLEPNKSTELAANNIRALFKTNGTHFFKENAEFEVPKGSGKTSLFAASLWLGGLDEQDNLHLAAMMYRQVGNDFWTGPISDDNDAATYYDKFWSVSKEEIENHKLNYNNPEYLIPSSITNWPAHGRTEYGESYHLAPYVSVSGNEHYAPELGDYPLIRGDQAIFWINNDACGAHVESKGIPLDVEILSMAYAYNSSDEALKNTIFISYVLRNKSKNNYKDFYIGFFSDFDIGYGYDDYIGCDTLLNLCYGYNGKEIDGSGQPHAYGANPPAQGAMFLNQKMNAFMYFNNSGNVTGNPTNALEYYNYLQAKWKDGMHLTLGKTGHNPESVEYTNFAFSGALINGVPWCEDTPNGPGSTPNTPDDRRGVMSAGPLTLPAGEGICLDVALPFARDYEGRLSSVTLLLKRTQEIQQFYNNQNYANNCFATVGIKEHTIHNAKLLIYPNPSNGQFTITCEKVIESIELYDVLGRKVFTDTPKAQSTQISTGLSKGLYMYRAMLQDNTTCSGKILVQ